MRTFKCDNCGREVEEKALYRVPISWYDFDTQSLSVPLDHEIHTEDVDLCHTCFHLYIDKANKLYLDFSHQLKNKQ